MYQDEKETIWNNYINEVRKNVDPDDAIVLFDDSDINKEYSTKLEDLDRVMDASSKDKKIVNGYHVCEATILTKNKKQPMSIYSKIYSCKSKDFKSKNIYTLESIKAAENVVGKNFTGVFDRGYDDNKIFDYMSKNNHKFIVRLDDKRTLLFKNKKRSVEDVAKSRKGKISMKALFNDNEEYDFENMRVRTLESMNNLNMMLTIHLGHIAILADKMDEKLLTIKILYASKSLKQNSIVWLSQIARGIKNILAYAHEGIKKWQEIEEKEKYKQLTLKI